MSEDTPIHDRIAAGDTPEEQNITGADEKTGWFTEARRRWIYSIVTAVLALVAVYLGIDAATKELWLNLVAAILALGGSASSELARRNVR